MPRVDCRRSQRGFTLFEMVVVICAIVILYMVAETRLNELPAAAERANFYAGLQQFKTAINFQMMSASSGGPGATAALEGTNPTYLLTEVPPNYRGELEFVTDTVRLRNSWYFERATGELVYVVGGPSIRDVLVTVAGTPVNLGQLRFKLMNNYLTEESLRNRTGIGLTVREIEDNRRTGTWSGLVLAPVYPYSWERRSEQPVPLQ